MNAAGPAQRVAHRHRVRAPVGVAPQQPEQHHVDQHQPSQDTEHRLVTTRPGPSQCQPGPASGLMTAPASPRPRPLLPVDRDNTSLARRRPARPRGEFDTRHDPLLRADRAAAPTGAHPRRSPPLRRHHRRPARLIHGARRLVLRLREVKALLEVRDTGTCPCQPAEVLFRQHFTEVDVKTQAADGTARRARHHVRCAHRSNTIRHRVRVPAPTTSARRRRTRRGGETMTIDLDLCRCCDSSACDGSCCDCC